MSSSISWILGLCICSGIGRAVEVNGTNDRNLLTNLHQFGQLQYGDFQVNPSAGSWSQHRLQEYLIKRIALMSELKLS